MNKLLNSLDKLAIILMILSVPACVAGNHLEHEITRSIGIILFGTGLCMRILLGCL